MEINHPLKVYYPYGGKHYICKYYTHNEQNQIVLARSVKNLETVVARVIESSKIDEFELKEYFQAELVAPHKMLCELAIKKDAEEKAEQFFQQVAFHLMEYKYYLPPVFKLCTNYEASYKSDNLECEQSHSNCKNCLLEYALNGMTKEEFYLQYHDAWEQAFPKKDWVGGKPRKISSYSQAEMAKETDALFAVKTDFGDHQSGLAIRKIEMDEDYYPTVCCFYFRNRRNLNMNALQSLKKNLHQKMKEAQSKVQEQNRAVAKLRKEQELLALKKLFG